MIISKGVREGEKPWWAQASGKLSGKRWNLNWALKEEKEKKEEIKVFFFEKMKTENKEHWDSNKHHLSDSTSIIALYSRR